MTVKQHHVTNWGALGLSPPYQKAIEQSARVKQAALWEAHGDDLIGIPEVEIWNNLVHRWLTERVMRSLRRA